MCDGYSIENKGLTMDWDDNPAHKPEPIKTSFPILFVSNSADPVVSLTGKLPFVLHSFMPSIKRHYFSYEEIYLDFSNSSIT
jgi:hypothetical protein